MPTNEARRKLTACGMFILPLVLVKLTAVMLGGGPAPTNAVPKPVAGPSGMPLTLGPNAPRETGHAAADYVQALRTQPFGPTPLYYHPSGTGAAAPANPTPVAPGPQPELEVRVQAVMAAGSGNMALVNGKMRRVGEELDDTGWRIVAISAEQRSVTVENASTGRREVFGVRTP